MTFSTLLSLLTSRLSNPSRQHPSPGLWHFCRPCSLPAAQAAMAMTRPFLSLGDTTVVDMPIHSMSYEKPKPFPISYIVTLLDALVELIYSCFAYSPCTNDLMMSR